MEYSIPTISVIIPVLNAATTIGRTLHGLAAQSLAADFEVIVVDGGSTDATLEILGSAANPVTVLHNPQGDPASARNLGAARARADVLAFTDADCVPQPGWLAAGLRAIGTASLVQGGVIPDGPCGPFDRTVVVDGEHGLYETANLFVTREAFDRAGGFAPVPGLTLAPGTHFGEDTWFAWRAKRAGLASAFCAEAEVAHAVFPRSARGYVAERERCAYFPALVAAAPELRGAFLSRRWFLAPGSARFDLAALGACMALCAHRPRGRAAGVLLTVPWTAATSAAARRSGPSRSAPARAAAWAAADAVAAAALVAGSVRHRTLVL